jgi:hypothetical protein
MGKYCTHFFPNPLQVACEYIHMAPLDTKGYFAVQTSCTSTTEFAKSVPNVSNSAQ